MEGVVGKLTKCQLDYVLSSLTYTHGCKCSFCIDMELFISDQSRELNPALRASAGRLLRDYTRWLKS